MNGVIAINIIINDCIKKNRNMPILFYWDGEKNIKTVLFEDDDSLLNIKKKYMLDKGINLKYSEDMLDVLVNSAIKKNRVIKGLNEIIEETLSYEEDHLIVPTYGELELMASTVAIVNENSVNWIDNNMEYYVVSDTLSKNELLEIARSISVLPVSK